MPKRMAKLREDPIRLYLLWSGVWSATFRAFGFSALIYWVVDADLDPLQLVLLGTALEVSVLTAEIPTGVMADTFSRKWSIVVSHVVMGVGMILTGATVAFVPLMISQVVWGVGWTFTSGADVAWITDEMAADETPGINGVIAASGRWKQIGGIVGLVLGGGLSWATSLATTIVVAGVISILVGGVIAITFSERGFTRTKSDHLATSWRILTDGLRLARSDHQILLVLGATVLLNSGAEAVDRLHTRQLVDLGLPVSPEPIVWFTGLGIVGLLAGVLALRVVENRIEHVGAPRRLYVAAVALAVIGTLLLATAPNTAVGFGGTFITRGIAWSVIPVIAATWVNQRATSDVRATVQSFLGQAESVGEISGGLVLGGLAQARGVPTSLAVASGLFATASLLVWRSKAGRVDAAVLSR